MAIDTPATLAVLGAGPIGLEAALYARFLGYSVVIYEQGEVAEHVGRAGHLRLFPTFHALHSNLGLAAIRAQEENYTPPDEQQRPTASEWRDKYLLPLAHTDLLSDSLRLQTQVLGVTKGELLKGDLAGDPDRGDWPFRILSQNAAGEERVDEVDAVLDCTGVFSQPNCLGEGGLPALGERSLAGAIARHIPDVLGAERARYAGKHTSVVGSGHSAATSVLALVELSQTAPGTQVTWITRRERATVPLGPVRQIENDPLAARDALATQANLLAQAGTTLCWLPGTWVERIGTTGEAFELQLAGEHPQTLACDEVIANVGYRPDTRLFADLQADLSPATEAIENILLTGEPNFYLLGAKSFGRRSGFQFSVGLRQIRDLFAVIGDRPNLDLYASAVKLS
jgi:thioredoxin reductase